MPGLIPRESISLLVHAPCTGSKRLLLSQFNNYANPIDDLPFLDIPIPGPRVQLGMILISAFVDEIEQRVEELGLDHLTKKTFPVVKWPGLKEKDQVDYFEGVRLLLDGSYECLTAKAEGRRPKLLLIESLHGMVPSKRISDVDVIIELFNTLKKFCIEKGCAILGTIAEAKDRPHGRTPSRILGSVQWAMNASSILGLEEWKPPATIRRLNIYSKTARGQLGPKWADFKQGRLLICAAPENLRSTKQDRMFDVLGEEGVGDEFDRATLLKWGKGVGVGVRTVDKWIAKCVDLGILIKGGTPAATVFRRGLPN